MKFIKLKSAVFASLLAVSLMAATTGVVNANNTAKDNAQVASYLTNGVLDKFSLNTIFSSIKASKEQNYTYLQAQDIATSMHYNHPMFKNKEMANKILDYYLSYPNEIALDPSKLFFTKQDVDGFRAKYTTGSVPAIISSAQPAYDIYQIYARRASEFYRKQTEYVLSLTKPINLDTNLRMPSIEKAQWRDESKTSLDELVRLKTIDDLIAIKLDKPDFTWDQIRARLVRSLVWREKLLNNYDQTAPFKTFMQAFAFSLDTHSAYYAAENEFSDTISPDLVGIGVGISQDVNGIITIPNVIKDGPAARQGGIDANDEIDAVSQDGKRWVNVDDLSLTKVVNMIKGQINTRVWLKLTGANGKEKIVSIVRGRVPKTETIANLNTFTDDKGNKYGVLRFGMFYQGADRDIRNLLKNRNDLNGLIIDLRTNGGGLVDEVQGIADIFLPTFASLFQTNDSPAQLRGSQRNIRPTRFAESNVKFDKPLIVMTDQFSASASEILSAAIQDYKRGIIVGNRTYGKGTVQGPSDITPYGNDGVIKLTIQKFFRVNGSSTQFKGVTPDVVLPEAANRKQTEEASINPLPYTFVNPTKYTPFTQYVNDNVVRELQVFANNYLKNTDNARDYVAAVQKTIANDRKPYTVLNYSALKDIKTFNENFAIKNYNIWARANGKPTISTTEEFRKIAQQAGSDFKVYDPYLDLSKEMLIKYSNLVKK